MMSVDENEQAGEDLPKRGLRTLLDGTYQAGDGCKGITWWARSMRD